MVDKVNTIRLHSQSHISAMLSKDEREKLKCALPLNISNGYRLINEKLPHLSRGQISQAFLYDNRYKPEVMKAAYEVIEEYAIQESPLKHKVASL